MNQSINQSAINESINKTVSQSTHQSVNCYRMFNYYYYTHTNTQPFTAMTHVHNAIKSNAQTAPEELKGLQKR